MKRKVYKGSTAYLDSKKYYMYSDIINKINQKIKGYTFFEFKILSYNKNLLILAGSEDFYYYHNIELQFNDVFTIISNLTWRVDTKIDCIEVLSGSEAIKLNQEYCVEKGNMIFRFHCEDSMKFYIIARSISFNNSIVKYHT